MNKLHQKKILSAVVSMLMTTAVCQGVSVHASDIEIYSAWFTPNPVVMFALDNSGSMTNNSGNRRNRVLKEAVEAALMGSGSGTNKIDPVRNIRAGFAVFNNNPTIANTTIFIVFLIFLKSMALLVYCWINL